MKRKFLSLGAALLVFAFVGPPIRAQSGITGNLTAASTNCLTTNSCLEVDIPPGMGSATIKMAGTMNVVAQFEVSADPLTVPLASAKWVAFSMNPSDGTVAATSATESGSTLTLAWQQNVGAYKRIRLRVSTYTSGTVAGAINLSTASARSGGGGGSGISGSGASPQVAFWSSPTAVSGDAQFLWDNTNKDMTVGSANSTFASSVQNQLFTPDQSVISYKGLLSNSDTSSSTLGQVALALQSQNTGGITAAGLYTKGYTIANTNASWGLESDEIVVLPVAGTNSTPQLAGLFFGGNQSPLGTTVGSLTAVEAQTNTSIGLGTTTNQQGIYVTSTNNGTVVNYFGINVDGAHPGSASNCSICLSSIGTGANDYSIKSAGGKIDLANNSTGAANGIFTVRGVGLGSFLGSPVGAYLETESDASFSWPLAIHDKTAVANSGFVVDALDNGTVEIGFSGDGSGSSLISNDSSNNMVISAAGPTVTINNKLIAPSYTTATNCTSSASPAVCAAAPAGSVVVAAAATSVVVNTSAVTANSQIFVQFDSSLGTKLGVTCNATVDLGQVTARSAGVSFTITSAAAPAVNPACYSFFLVN